MFKVVALAGMIAGGAVYGLYEYTNVLCLHCDSQKTCGLTSKKSCCDATVEPECCVLQSECCYQHALGSVAGTMAISTTVSKPAGCSVAKATCDTSSSCCSTTKVSAVKKATCCADPCPQCQVACEVCCPACPVVCGECCGVSVKTAVGGTAAIAASLKK